MTKWALNSIDGFDFYGQSSSTRGTRHFLVVQATLLRLLGLPFTEFPTVLLNMMWYLMRLPWISPCSFPERSIFTAVSKKKFGEYALLNTDTIPVALGGKCLRTTCLLTLQVNFTCLIVLIQHWQKKFLFLCFCPIESRNSFELEVEACILCYACEVKSTDCID